MRECGYRTKYAPITPAMAPLAPTIGTTDSGLVTVCRSAAKEIEGDEPAVAHAILDVVTKDPEVEHVPCEVKDAAVQKHRRHDGEPREGGGNQTPVEDELLHRRAQ